MIPITGIQIVQGKRSGNIIPFTAVLTPSNTTQDDVIWSVEGNYISITPNKLQSVLNIQRGANNERVTLKCMSAKKTSVVDSVTLTVTYDDSIVIPITAIADIITVIPEQNKLQCVAVLEPSDTTQTDIEWSIVSGDAVIDDNGLISYNSTGDIIVQATSAFNAGIKSCDAVPTYKP